MSSNFSEVIVDTCTAESLVAPFVTGAILFAGDTGEVEMLGPHL